MILSRALQQAGPGPFLFSETMASPLLEQSKDVGLGVQRRVDQAAEPSLLEGSRCR